MAGALFDIKLLEGALKWWECRAFTLNVVRQRKQDRGLNKTGKQKALRFIDDYHTFLLHSARQSETVFSDRYFFTDQTNINMTGAAIFGWNAFSRRVYTMSDELRVMLEATSFKSVAWKDVPWPFSVFMIAFEKPIELKAGCQIGAVICARVGSQYPNSEELSFMLMLPTGLEDFAGLTEKQSARLIRLIQQKDQEGVNEWTAGINQKANKFGVGPYVGFFGGKERLNVTIEEKYRLDLDNCPPETDENMSARMREIIRLAAAFSFYLTTFPTGSPEHSKHVQPGPLPPSIKQNDPRLVSLKSNVCRVTSSFTLRPGEQEKMEDAIARARTGEIVPHWRTGHFRKPPGKGSDVTALKTVWVNPCFVNLENLPEGTLPGGAHVRVHAPEPEPEGEMI